MGELITDIKSQLAGITASTLRRMIHNDRMGERVTLLRTGASPYCIIGGLPFVYPIVHTFLSRETE